MATTPVGRETADLPFVDTWMNFSGPIEGRARVDVPNWSNTNMALQKHDLRIHDARPIAGLLSLDREGFTLVRHECGLTGASDMEARAPDYQAAVAGLLKELSGASFVLPQGKGLVKRSMEEGAIGPSRWVHMDYTTAAAHKWVEWIEGWEGLPLRHYPRFAVYQTWRCLTPPPTRAGTPSRCTIRSTCPPKARRRGSAWKRGSSPSSSEAVRGRSGEAHGGRSCRARYCFRPTPPYMATSAGSPQGVASGRQREHDTTPGSSRSRPSKKRVTCSGVRCVSFGVPCSFQNATAASTSGIAGLVIVCDRTR